MTQSSTILKSKVDLKAKPFYLSDHDIKWVNDTIEHMTLEEKIGQLFIHLEESEDMSQFLEDLEKIPYWRSPV